MPRLIPNNDLTTDSLDQDTDTLPGTGFAREELEAAVLALKSILDGYQGEVLYSSADPGATEADLALKNVSNLFEALQTFEATNAIVCRPDVNDAIQVPLSIQNGPAGTMKYRIQVDGAINGLFRLQRADQQSIFIGRQDSNTLDLQNGRAFYNGLGLAFVSEIPADPLFSVIQSFTSVNTLASFTVSSGFGIAGWTVSGTYRTDNAIDNSRWIARDGQGGEYHGGTGQDPWSLVPPATPPIPAGSGQLAVNFRGGESGTIGWNMKLLAHNMT